MTEKQKITNAIKNNSATFSDVVLMAMDLCNRFGKVYPGFLHTNKRTLSIWAPIGRPRFRWKYYTNLARQSSGNFKEAYIVWQHEANEIRIANLVTKQTFKMPKPKGIRKPQKRKRKRVPVRDQTRVSIRSKRTNLVRKSVELCCCRTNDRYKGDENRHV